MAKKTRTELSTLAVNTNLPDNTSEQITPTTERAQLTEERDSVINYKDDLGGTSNAGKFLTVGSDGESLTMVDGATGDVTGTGVSGRVTIWDGTNSITSKAMLVLDDTNKILKIVIPSGNASGGISIDQEGTTGTSSLTFLDDGVYKAQIVYNVSDGNLTLNSNGDIKITPTGDTVISGGTPIVEHVRILSGGNVGIGTASPSVKLEAHGSIRAVNSGTTTKHASINPDGLYIAGAQDGYLVSPQAWEFYAGNTKRMTIDSSGNIGAPSGSNIYSASDQRLKKNINSISEGLNKINNLNPINFNWIDGFCDEEKDKTLSGFVAQEVKNVIPEAVNSFTDDSITVNGETIEEPLSVNEKLIIPYLVKAIQQLTARIESLENG